MGSSGVIYTPNMFVFTLMKLSTGTAVWKLEAGASTNHQGVSRSVLLYPNACIIHITLSHCTRIVSSHVIPRREWLDTFREFAYGDMPDAGLGSSALDGPLDVLKQATVLLEKNFHPFVELPEQQQTALSDILQAVLFDEELLVVLEQVCDDVVRGLSPPLAIPGELKPPQQQDLMAFLSLVGYRVQGGCPDQEDAISNQKLFSAAHFLVSALAEMPDNVAALLGACCRLQIIPTLCHLLRALSDNGVSDLENPDLAPLKDMERFMIVQRLFALADMNLERLQSSVKVVTQKDPNILPLILYISLNGLCALGRAH
ncbi:gasdermin-E-like [Vulpes lagopus]|uniref:gasdermin-E-like n=1 Tax=Vulpes lagopus TaxID=494514 RepID=UPI001BC8FDC5|nr:gasdermin-E-like [Vulpes lagopus]